MKFLSRRILVVLALGFAVWLSGEYLCAQSDKNEKESQPNSANQMLWTDSEYADLLNLMDADQDGSITKEEWESVFAKKDKNADNRLSPKEIESFTDKAAEEASADPNQGRLAAFNRLDANKNDAIDSSEWPGKDMDFDYVDANLNGSLSREEFLSVKGRFWNEPFENLDFNDDGIISRSEWLDSDKSFDRIDRDKNGAVERREFYDRR
jgi:Ca2+-binding EF-hand superfamily protein